jgi:hypothetical protein
VCLRRNSHASTDGDGLSVNDERHKRRRQLDVWRPGGKKRVKQRGVGSVTQDTRAGRGREGTREAKGKAN